MVVLWVLVQYLLFKVWSQFLVTDRKLLSLVDNGFCVLERVEDGEVFFVEGFPPLLGFSFSVILYLCISTLTVTAVLRCLHFPNPPSSWECLPIYLRIATLLLKFYFRIIFSPRRLSFDLLSCPGTVNYYYSFASSGDILICVMLSIKKR